MCMKSYRELEIYQLFKKLAIEVQSMSMSLPKFELYEEGGQIRRSSKSVTAMIAETQAECDETIVHLEFLFETKSFSDRQCFDRLREEYALLSKKINKFIQWVEGNWNDFSQPGPSNLEQGTSNNLS